MLLEQLVGKANQEPEYDWESYYLWRFSQLAGREIANSISWLCRRCLTVNMTYLPARYGKCRSCRLIHLPDDLFRREDAPLPAL